jgi:excisionase family DNA binding protein
VNEKVRVAKLLDLHDATIFTNSTIPLLDILTVAQRLECSERFVRRLVQERRIPFVRLGGTRIRFIAEDVDEWVAGQRVSARTS